MNTEHRFGKATKKQILLYTALMLVVFAVMIGYLKGGNQLFETEEVEEYNTVYEVTLPMYNVHSLNPAASTDSDTYQLASLIYDGLFSLDDTMSPQQNLAASYTFDQEAGSITIQLVSTTFHDGKALTGEDVVFSIQAYKLAGDGCNYSHLVEAISKAEASGNTVTIWFNDSSNMSLAQLTFPILPAHQFSSLSEAISTDEDFVPIGTGPYQVDSWSATSTLVLVPNEDYHGTVAQNTLTFDTESIRGDLYQLLQAGGISIFFSEDADRATYITKSNITLTDFIANKMEYLCFNCEDDALSDPLVRQAICTAVDCVSINESQYYSSGVLNGNLYFPGYLGLSVEEDLYSYDLQEAAALLVEAGYIDTDDNGYIINRKGETLDVTIVVRSKDEEHSGTASLVEEALTNLGIDVTVVTYDTNAAYYAALRGGYYGLYFGTYTFDEQMDLRVLLGDTSTNYSRYENETLSNLLDEMQSGLTVSEMKTTCAKIQDILQAEVPYYCILFRTYGAIQSSTFEGTLTPTWHSYYYNCYDWHNNYLVTDEEDAEE